MMMHSIQTRLFVACGLSLCTLAANVSAGVFLGTPVTTDTRHGSYSYAGIQFTANAATVNELGYWVSSTDSSGAGITAVAHTVGLFESVGSGNYKDVAQVTFPLDSSPTVSNGYAWLSVPSVTLVAGATYALVATQNTDLWGPNNGSSTFAPVNASFGTLTDTAGAYSGGGDTMPGVGNSTTAISNFTDNGGYAGPNIGFAVPEPASIVLCGLGALGLLFAARRCRKA